MARVGIDTNTALGVTVTELRRLGRSLGRDHALAAELWASGIHDARILASIVDDPEAVTKRQMESWVRGFGSWDLCDQVCMNLFDRTPFAFEKAVSGARANPSSRSARASRSWRARRSTARIARTATSTPSYPGSARRRPTSATT
ncbi:MAG TPA: DNA alkylation repair protein [Actinomycetota bacterium]|nr:DNA alkylation repair protein [Actinomycetota bacterium]